MNTPILSDRYKHHRFLAEIISHAVRLYCRFCLRSRDVEELLFARCIIVTYEAIRKWCRKFGQQYAHQLHRRHLQPGDTWHVDEIFLTIRGKQPYLCRVAGSRGAIGTASCHIVDFTFISLFRHGHGLPSGNARRTSAAEVARCAAGLLW